MAIVPVVGFLVPDSGRHGRHHTVLVREGTKSDATDTRLIHPPQSKVQRKEDRLEDLLVQDVWRQNPFNYSDQLVRSVIASDETKVDTRLVPVIATDTAFTTTASISKKHQKLFRRLLVDTSTSNIRDDDDEEDDPFHTQAQPQEQPPPNAKSYRQSYRLDVAYYGPSFCGWQTQPPPNSRNTHPTTNRTALAPVPSVQQTLEEWLQGSGMHVPSKRAQTEYHKQKRDSIIRVDLRAAGRTDAGVHAVGQVARFRTWVPTNNNINNTQEEEHLSNSNSNGITINAQNIHNYINQHPMAGTDFRCVSVTPVSSQFHPTFGASCRAYLYVIDVQPIHQQLLSRQNTKNPVSVTDLVQNIQTLLQPLVGEDLDYVAMSYGKIKTQTTLCHLVVARAFLATSTNVTIDTNHDHEPPALCIQLVGNRFLRRMVRILVATAMREAIIMTALQLQNHDTDNNPQEESYNRRLLKILQTKDRRQSARPAPSPGLIFAGALFHEA